MIKTKFLIFTKLIFQLTLFRKFTHREFTHKISQSQQTSAMAKLGVKLSNKFKSADIKRGGKKIMGYIKCAVCHRKIYVSGNELTNNSATLALVGKLARSATGNNICPDCRRAGKEGAVQAVHLPAW